MKVVVTGEIGSGKSTVVRAVMAALGWEKPGGFFTHWGGAVRGAQVLQLETWEGRTVPFARRVAEPVAEGRLPYRLETAGVSLAVGCLGPGAEGRPVVVDELGLMELDCEEFMLAVKQRLAGPGAVMAVIQQRALEAWRLRLGEVWIDRVMRVEPGTRDALSAAIAGLFRA